MTLETNKEQESSLFPIRTVSALTGVNPITLRAWERRYQLIVPKRTPKGHRLYTKNDIENINHITTLLNQGISIGQVKPLLEQQLSSLFSQNKEDTENIWEKYRLMMLDAISRFDQNRLDNIYNDALSLYPIDIISSNLITPLLRELGENWKKNSSGIAEEHFFSVYLRNKLGSRIQHLNQQTTGPLLLIACLPGEQHETGMLLFSLTMLNHGYRTLILGTNLPLDQIPIVIEKRPCDAIILSGFARPAKNLFSELLPQLTSQVDIPVFVGGALASRYQKEIRSIGAIPTGSDIQEGLAIINKSLRS